jgi:hypothetical protein
MLRRSPAFPLRSQFLKHCIRFRQAVPQRRLRPSHLLAELHGQLGNYLFLFGRPAFAFGNYSPAPTARSFSFSTIIGPNCDTLPAPSVRIMSPSCAAAAAAFTASANEPEY